MKKHSDELMNGDPFNPGRLNTPARSHVRYLGFEGIEGGRRLMFSLKSIGHDSVVITIEISDAPFTGASGISIQDAAPMAFEKIVELLATKLRLEPNELRLTDADIAQYITRHLSSQKHAHSNGRLPSDVAA